MKNLFKIFLLVFVIIMACSKGDEPTKQKEEQPTPIPTPTVTAVAMLPDGYIFKHPGALITQESLARMKAKVNSNASPWVDNYNDLINNPLSLAKLTYNSNPKEYLCRGGGCATGGNEEAKVLEENYVAYSRDIAAAFGCALRYLISDDTAYANKAVQIMNAWSSKLTLITGDSNRALLSGNFAYQFAVVGEMMKNYTGWNATDQQAYKNMLLNEAYPVCRAFLDTHWGQCDSHYRSNWDAVNMAGIIAIAVYTDDVEKFNYVVNYYQKGKGNGNINKLIHTLHDNPDAPNGPSKIGQTEEAGRDQGHNQGSIGWMGVVCEIAWNQGVDLYGYDDNRFLKGAEYVSRYNLGLGVPYSPYKNCQPNHPAEPIVSDIDRGDKAPNYESVFNHYVKRKGLKAQYLGLMVNRLRPEQPNYIIRNSICCSWGFDMFGWGTLLYALD